MLSVELIPFTLRFNFSAKTSRSVLRELNTLIVKITDTTVQVSGWGECCVLEGLSADEDIDYHSYDPKILQAIEALVIEADTDVLALVQEVVPPEHRSMQMAVETALLDLQNGGKQEIFGGPFYDGDKEILLNGLIWMGHSEFMLQQISQKIYDGYKTIKMKIGGIDFDMECDILDYVRRRYFKDDIVIRLDANGSFKPDEALHKLERLSRFNIHSIEQPLPAGSSQLKDLIQKSPIPIALDEELIPVRDFDQKVDLLDELQPHYLILKPSLLGGFQSTKEWIGLAESKGVDWWITSALESNIGLNAIAQFVSQYDNELPQGLGTGQLYENNFDSPLKLKRDLMSYNPKSEWDLTINQDE